MFPANSSSMLYCIRGQEDKRCKQRLCFVQTFVISSLVLMLKQSLATSSEAGPVFYVTTVLKCKKKQKNRGKETE